MTPPIVIVAIVALVAGSNAYLISLQEMRQHLHRPQAHREALRTGAVTATVFLIISGVCALALTRMFR
jgi:uncharacterized membrane protein YidH (DUF202 family)